MQTLYPFLLYHCDTFSLSPTHRLFHHSPVTSTTRCSIPLRSSPIPPTPPQTLLLSTPSTIFDRPCPSPNPQFFKLAPTTVLPPPAPSFPAMPSTPTCSDDEDSIYDGSPCAPPSRLPLHDKILDLHDDSVHQLDMYLDGEDRDYESENANAASTSTVETNASLSSPDQSDEPEDDEDATALGDSYCESPTATGAVHVLGSPRVNQGVEILEDEATGEPPRDLDEDDIGVVEVVGMDDDEDWFDSDENKVDVESLESSSSEEVKTTIQESQSEKKASKGGGKSLLTRASHTFYKAFGMGGKKTEHKERKGGKGEKGEEVDGRYKRLEDLLHGQIGTLNGARTGFVDLRLLRPMTERTIEAIGRDGKELLGDFGRLEKKIREVEEMEKGDDGTSGELQMKERMLIEAKVRLAEVAADVDRLRHELRKTQKELETMEREEAKRWEIEKGRREKVKREAQVAREGREVAEQRLEREKERLEREKCQLERVEKGYRDIEGDWA